MNNPKAAQGSSDFGRRKHDLMAPLCNIRAFTEELRYVAESLDKVVEEHRDALPESLLDNLTRLADEDIRVCTDALGRASDSLDTQLHELLNTTASQE